MRIAVRDKALEVLAQPRSVSEMSDIMGVNYHTARRYIVELMQANLVAELPVRNESNAILYKVRSENAESLEWYFPMGKEMVTLADATERVSRFINAMQNPGSMLAFLAQRSYWLQRNAGRDAMDPARRYEGGPRGNVVEMRATLRTMAQSLEKVSKLLFTISMRDDLWEADNRVVGSLFERSGWATRDEDMVTSVERMHALAEEAFQATFQRVSPSNVARETTNPPPEFNGVPSPPVESLIARVVEPVE